MKKTKNTKDEQLARVLADYDNLKKRHERERDEYMAHAGAKIIMKLLGVLDMLDSAKKHSEDSGIAIVAEEFRNVLKDEGVVEMGVKSGDKFDENLHDAVDAVEKKGMKKGEIVDIILSGWKYSDGLVLRPAKVIVVK